MVEIDLVPGEYRRFLALRSWLRSFAMIYLSVIVSLGVAKAALAYGIRAKDRAIEQLEAARAVEQSQQLRLGELREQRSVAARRLMILSGLRGGIAAKDMFLIVDRATGGNVWFLDWKFRRAGELVENDPEAVQTGYFIVVPMEQRDEREKAWLMRTHMEIRAQAFDHSTLAHFVRRLVEQPEIEEVRVLNTRTRQYTSAEVVDFELAVVVKTQT